MFYFLAYFMTKERPIRREMNFNELKNFGSSEIARGFFISPRRMIVLIVPSKFVS